MNLKGDLDLSKIVNCDFPETQYFKVDHPKTQIVLHHSAGWDNPKGMFEGWKLDKQRVATCCGMDDKGIIYYIYPSKYWAYHVNIKSKGNNDVLKDRPELSKYFHDNTAVDIENRTIGMEVCNWGGLKFVDGKFHTWASSKVSDNPDHKREITLPDHKIMHYPNKFRGYEFFERYTDAEIEQMWRWIRYCCKTYGIPAKCPGDFFGINEDAYKGTPGVYGHVSFRIDKQDLHPQPELVEMLKAL